ncbi:hypothetical protein ACJQWK_03311 [Exserohilum turcicum]
MLVIGGWFPVYDKCDAPEGQGQHNMVLGYNGEDAKLWDKYQPQIHQYVVPSPIIAAIGGGPTGGATKTAPQQWGHPDLATYYTLKPSFAARSATRLIPSPTGSLSSDGDKKTNVAAIAGGVVGGLVGLIAILCLILFCLHRRKKALKEKREKEGDASNAPPPPPPAELATTIPQELAASEANKYVPINQIDSPALAQYPEHAQQHSHSNSHDYTSAYPAQGPPSYGHTPPYTSPVVPASQMSPRGDQTFSDMDGSHTSPSTAWGTHAEFPSPGPGHEGHYSYPTPVTPRQPSADFIQPHAPVYYPHPGAAAAHGQPPPTNFAEEGGNFHVQQYQSTSTTNTPTQFYSQPVQSGSPGRISERRGPVQGKFMEEEHM